MNAYAYPAFPTPCLEGEKRSRERSHSLVPQAYPVQNNVLQQCRKRALQTHSEVVVESLLSPLKYAFFQVLGTAFLRLVNASTTQSFTTSAKIGAYGGTLVTILYIFLILTRSSTSPPKASNPQNDTALRSLRQSVEVFVDETAYSIVASLVGCIAYGKTGTCQVDLLVQTLAGGAGPLLFLVMLAFSVGFIWSTLRVYKRTLDWYAGY